MEEKNNGGQEKSTGNYTNEGRKLRPRKKVGYEKPYGEHRPYGERRSSGEYKPHGEHRPYGDRPQGDRKPYGERKTYGGRKPYGERSSFHGHEDGDRKPFGEHRPFGERKSFGGHKPFGERKPYGERRSSGEHRPFGEKRSFEDRKPFHSKRNEPRFTPTDEAGINEMLRNKPAIDPSSTDPGTVQTPIKEVERLNKFIANSGVCSRREADTYIQAGVVTVNGEVVTELGTKVNVLTDDVRFNGERLKGEAKVYIVMNKPRGYVTTASDPHADKTVMDLIRGCKTRVFPVGRLDKNTTGVLMFTNDGEIAEMLTHPSFNKKKIYQVILDKALEEEDKARIMEGVELGDGVVKADELEYIDAEDHRRLGIEIHSGKNRVVRRIFESLGYTVKALDRVYFAGLTKKGLQKGEWRYLTTGEINILKMGAYV